MSGIVQENSFIFLNALGKLFIAFMIYITTQHVLCLHVCQQLVLFIFLMRNLSSHHHQLVFGALLIVDDVLSRLQTLRFHLLDSDLIMAETSEVAKLHFQKLVAVGSRALIQRSCRNIHSLIVKINLSTL